MGTDVDGGDISDDEDDNISDDEDDNIETKPNISGDDTVFLESTSPILAEESDDDD